MILRKRQPGVSDSHTLFVALGVLRSAKANPKLIAAMDDLRVRILNEEEAEFSMDATEAQ